MAEASSSCIHIARWGPSLTYILTSRKSFSHTVKSMASFAHVVESRPPVTHISSSRPVVSHKNRQFVCVTTLRVCVTSGFDSRACVTVVSRPAGVRDQLLRVLRMRKRWPLRCCVGERATTAPPARSMVQGRFRLRGHIVVDSARASARPRQRYKNGPPKLAVLRRPRWRVRWAFLRAESPKISA